MRFFNIILVGFLVVACLGSQSYAASDSKYPGAYFTPIIIYQDLELIEKLAGADESKKPSNSDESIEPTQASIAISTSTQKNQNVVQREQTRTDTLVEPSPPPAVLIGLAVAILGLVVFMPYTPREYGNSRLSDNEEIQAAADIPDEADDALEEANANDEEDTGDNKDVEPSVEKT